MKIILMVISPLLDSFTNLLDLIVY